MVMVLLMLAILRYSNHCSFKHRAQVELFNKVITLNFCSCSQYTKWQYNHFIGKHYSRVINAAFLVSIVTGARIVLTSLQNCEKKWLQD